VENTVISLYGIQGGKHSCPSVSRWKTQGFPYREFKVEKRNSRWKNGSFPYREFKVEKRIQGGKTDFPIGNSRWKTTI
jgi:hypothetical protein